MENAEPAAPLDYPPPPSGATPGRRWTIAAFALAAVALLVPILGGPAGAVAGILGLRRGDPLGKTAVLVSVGATVLGLVLGALVAGE